MGRALLVAVLALRNFWRQRRRSLMLVVAIAVAVGVLIWTDAIMRGWQRNIVDEIVETRVGHLQIHHPQYLDDPLARHAIVVSDDLRRALDGNREIRAWARRVVVPATVRSERETRGVLLFGIEPARERAVSFLGHVRLRGRLLESSDEAGVVIGRKLADDLETDIGKKLVVMTTDARGELAELGARVVGIFDAANDALERAYLVLAIGRAQRLLALGDGVSEVTALARDRRRVAGIVARLRHAAPGLDIRSWTDIEPRLAAVAAFMDVVVWIWRAVFLLALAFGVINTLLATVFERMREFGLLQALGVAPTALIGEVAVESWIIMLAGIAGGSLVGAALIAWVWHGIDLAALMGTQLSMPGFTRLIYPTFRWQDYLALVTFVLGLGFLASLYPAYRAVRLDPVATLNRH